MKRRRINEATWQQVRTAHASGIGLREIARNMGIPAGTVLAHAKRNGWTQQIQSAKALAKHADNTPAIAPFEAVAVSMQERGQRHVGRVAGITERMVSTFERLPDTEQLRCVDELEKTDRIARRTYGLGDGNSPASIVNVALLSL